MLRRPTSRRVATASLAALAVAGLAACAPSIGAVPADDAANPACAPVMLALPETLAGDLPTDPVPEGVAAWSTNSGEAVTLRCGVEVPGPSTERCITVESGDTSVDWLALEGDDEMVPEHGRRDNGAWTFVTYGRVPAVEVVVPTERGGDQPTAVLVDLAPAIERTTAERHCVGIGDVA